ncbi:hypothetical protein V1512DRAFT_291713 [Lipomyces arxii]|uniref:uncharacterized protein n=1 Tax=Lipomyces arxii TaxID=56418 RepID=UPI0034CFC243
MTTLYVSSTPSPPARSSLRPRPQLRTVQVPPQLRQRQPNATPLSPTQHQLNSSNTVQSVLPATSPHQPKRRPVRQTRRPLTSSNSIEISQIHRGNKHHLHLFSECQSPELLSARPYSAPPTYPPKQRVSSVPIIHDLHQNAFSAQKSQCSYPQPSNLAPAQEKLLWKTRVSSMPIIQSEVRKKPVKSQSRPQYHASQIPPHIEPEGKNIDLMFAPIDERQPDARWMRVMKRAIGASHITETADEALADGEPNKPVSFFLPKLSNMQPPKFNLFSRKNRFNLNDAIYGSIGKEVEIPVDMTPIYEHEMFQHNDLSDDDSSDPSDTDDTPVRRMPSVRQPQWKREADIRRRQVRSRSPARSGTVCSVRHTVVNNDGASVSVQKPFTASIRSHRIRHNVKRKPLPQSSIASSCRVSSMPGLSSSEQDEFEDWDELPSVAPLNITKSPALSSGLHSAPGSYIELQQLQSLMLSMTEESPSKDVDVTPIDIELKPQVKNSKTGDQSIWSHAILNDSIVNSAMAAMRIRKSRLIPKGTRLNQRRSSLEKPKRPQVGLATSSESLSLNSSLSKPSERISSILLRRCKKAEMPLVRLLAMPVDFVRFMATLFLFPPTSATLTPDEIERKDTLRSTVMDFVVCIELLCILWVAYTAYLTVISAFRLTGVLFYPLFAVGRFLSHCIGY